MKVTIDIECTPQEARTFFGMPDVEAFNAMVMSEMERRAKDNLETLADPEKFFAQWSTMSGKGLEQFRALMAAAMSGSGKRDQ